MFFLHENWWSVPCWGKAKEQDHSSQLGRGHGGGCDLSVDTHRHPDLTAPSVSMIQQHYINKQQHLVCVKVNET